MIRIAKKEILEGSLDSYRAGLAPNKASLSF